MRRRRLLVAAGAGVGDPRPTRPDWSTRLIGLALKTAAKGAYEDMSATAAAVRASDLDWTLVRIPMLTDRPTTGQPKVGYLGKGAGSRLSRADLAASCCAKPLIRTYVAPGAGGQQLRRPRFGLRLTAGSFSASSVRCAKLIDDDWLTRIA